jgi:hypothetical protein
LHIFCGSFFSSGHRAVCISSIYRFWLTPSYLQIFIRHVICDVNATLCKYILLYIYSETCLNWSLNKTESCINWTLSKVIMNVIHVKLSCINWTTVYSEHNCNSLGWYHVPIWLRRNLSLPTNVGLVLRKKISRWTNVGFVLRRNLSRRTNVGLVLRRILSWRTNVGLLLRRSLSRRTNVGLLLRRNLSRRTNVGLVLRGIISRRTNAGLVLRMQNSIFNYILVLLWR